METTLSTAQQAIIYAANIGYTCDGSNVISPNGNIILARKDNGGYFRFKIRFNKNTIAIRVHRLVAYQKFKMEMFKTGIEVRHLNGNPLDNSFGNIAIGTKSQNNMDKLPEQRLNAAIHATSFTKKHDHELILKMHKQGKSYKEIMAKTGISSKGTLSYIINKIIYNQH